MSIGPNSFVVVSTTRAMSAPLVRSPSTRMVRTPCAAATCFGDRRQRRSLAIFRRAVLAHAVDRDIGAEACEPFGERAAEPAAGAGDQRNLALQRPRGVV